MKRVVRVHLPLICLCAISFGLAHGAPGGWQYVFPAPGAEFVPCSTSLILRPGITLPGGYDPGAIRMTVSGDKSGLHTGIVALSDDRRTIIFTPRDPFAPRENVAARVVAPTLRLPPLELRFITVNVRHYDPAFWAGTSADIRPSKVSSKAPTNGIMTIH